MTPLPLNFIHLNTTDSTNSWAKLHLNSLPKDALTCIAADYQTGGKGRGTKKWVSPPHVNIYASFVFFVPTGFPYLHNSGQIISVSCTKTLQHYGLTPLIKWPNDILVDGKKIAGILTEVVSDQTLSAVIVGIGVNINMSKVQLAEVDQPATSVLDLNGQTIDLQAALTLLSHTFSQDVAHFLASGIQFCKNFYNKHLAFKGEKIRVRDGTAVLEGICEGIDSKGLLILNTRSNQKQSVSPSLNLMKGEII